MQPTILNCMRGEIKKRNGFLMDFRTGKSQIVKED